ncbi:Domain of uncharacterised function (DUF1508) [Mycobacteroides abscessus subsp. bolletii]|uniref:YegP family protein n=1 Tax=Mycobacteroides abscessus TaxID=36809 RepID=UPI000925A24B|nr:YegP family protein [Mycobacteroides abscessus]SIJ51452.1 Domain of uncharacterised function (DUF1508) [Mycobacteroides abscessus subsp. bolletii]SLD45949.1 Domain of uncharacterised function (DUF1508) [Mycobacteroides abscessus subsp. bolletii]SLE35486.1 Domain of uncharacterised function (DUF1508) [Mycobacteroides abscessus subsp. bolletii]
MILVEIYPDSADEYRWRAKDGENGRVIADSGEGYQNISDVERMIQRVFSGETARPPAPEPVHLRITYRGMAGPSDDEQIR